MNNECNWWNGRWIGLGMLSHIIILIVLLQSKSS